MEKNQKILATSNYGTVGAVAIDREGNVASAVSTGVRWLKLHGRIGDSAVIGGGFYADMKVVRHVLLEMANTL